MSIEHHTSGNTLLPKIEMLEMSALRFSSASMTACGAPGCKRPDKIQEAAAKIMGINGMVPGALSFGCVVVAASAALGAGLDPTSTAMAAMAGATTCVMGGFNPSKGKGNKRS